jgi:hypothetical protein
MADLPALTVTVNWANSVATVAVHGEPDHLTYSQLRDRLAWVTENRPQRLELGGMADRFGGQIIALLAAARQQLPPGCLLDVRSASPAVRRILEIAGWTGVQVST